MQKQLLALAANSPRHLFATSLGFGRHGASLSSRASRRLVGILLVLVRDRTQVKSLHDCFCPSQVSKGRCWGQIALITLDQLETCSCRAQASATTCAEGFCKRVCHAGGLDGPFQFRSAAKFAVTVKLGPLKQAFRYSTRSASGPLECSGGSLQYSTFEICIVFAAASAGSTWEPFQVRRAGVI